jgi:hypothetical protein
MRTKRLIVLSILACMSLVLVGLLQPTPVRADLGISGVQPSTVLSTNAVELVITGSDFMNGAVVILDTFGALNTTFVSDSVLRAELPAGVAAGVYTVKVINPDSSEVSLPNALTVVEPTATITPPTPTPVPAARPLIVVESYGTNVKSIKPGEEFNLQVKLKNMGGRSALNIVATFTPGDFIPRKSGGVVAVSEIGPGDNHRLNQPLIASPGLSGKTLSTLVMQVSYTDAAGTTYSETFNLTLSVTAPQYLPGPTSTPTPTPTSAASNRPQLVITTYDTDVPLLQPGYRFNLRLQVQNMGNTDAKRVTMILGGGSSSGGGLDGTPDVGGISGAGGDFGNFAPVASSNVQFLGDLPAGSTLDASATLIVNASANPGAYPMKITFAYVDERGRAFNDDQVITLLVYSLPIVEINFYRQPDPLFAGQPGLLPLQVVNLGRKTAILGNMKVTAQGAQFSNNTVLVGALDVGGYYTLDATVIPDQPGPLELLVTIDYTDDFNQPQVISRTLSVEVQEMIMPEPGAGEGEPIEPVLQPETFWQKVWRFVRGLLGLDSAVPTPAPLEVPPGEIPPSEVPPGQPLPRGGPKG